MPATQNSKYIKASPKTLYKAFTDPAALEKWLAPGEMKGKVHRFDLREGGEYQMSLFYPQSEKGSPSKTAEKEDRFTARFIKLIPYKKIIEGITFESSERAFHGEMIMEVSLQAKDKGTEVTISFRNIPPGIKPQDNEEGTRSTLEKLAHYAE